MKAIQIEQAGGPEVLKLKEVAIGQPGPGQALVRIAAAGVNFVEIYQRSGRYPMKLPVFRAARPAEWWRRWAQA